MSVKAWLRDRAGEVLLGAGLTSPARQAAGQLTIATFHRVLPEAQKAEYPMPGLVVTPAELEWFLAFFERHFEVGTLADAGAAWDQGVPSTRPRLALTFDDAQLDNYLHAKPVLEAAGVCATFFAPAGSVERGELLWHDRLAYGVAGAWPTRRSDAARVLAEFEVEVPEDAAPAEAARALVIAAKAATPAARAGWLDRVESALGPQCPAWDGLMTWAQLGALAETGHEVASHSLTHALLPQCGDEALRAEGSDSRRLLEERLGVEVISFCYPNGDCDDRSVRAVAAAGYRWGVSTEWGANAPGAERLRLARHEMHADHVRARDGAFSEPRLAWRMSRLHPAIGS
ncbi:MAG: polysaccharide deacetylase family protein [Myxococcales bacterium]|nr:polysaccharide deacetylase family protein [Myxococcales bacterium]